MDTPFYVMPSPNTVEKPGVDHAAQQIGRSGGGTVEGAAEPSNSISERDQLVPHEHHESEDRGQSRQHRDGDAGTDVHHERLPQPSVCGRAHKRFGERRVGHGENPNTLPSSGDGGSLGPIAQMHQTIAAVNRNNGIGDGAGPKNLS